MPSPEKEKQMVRQAIAKQLEILAERGRLDAPSPELGEFLCSVHNNLPIISKLYGNVQQIHPSKLGIYDHSKRGDPNPFTQRSSLDDVSRRKQSVENWNVG